MEQSLQKAMDLQTAKTLLEPTAQERGCSTAEALVVMLQWR
jgi:hypothetical protein